MVWSSSQQVVVAFTVVLFSVVVLPRMLGVGSGPAGTETRGFDPRYHRKGTLSPPDSRWMESGVGLSAS